MGNFYGLATDKDSAEGIDLRNIIACSTEGAQSGLLYSEIKERHSKVPAWNHS